jgi:hypothetical protein
MIHGDYTCENEERIHGRKVTPKKIKIPIIIKIT